VLIVCGDPKVDRHPLELRCHSEKVSNIRPYLDRARVKVLHRLLNSFTSACNKVGGDCGADESGQVHTYAVSGTGRAFWTPDFPPPQVNAGVKSFMSKCRRYRSL
jgi:hypothetical protein